MDTEDEIKTNDKNLLEVVGVVVEILPDFTFKVELGKDQFLLAKGSGRLRKKRIRISMLDKVLIEISPYDLNYGRIARRLDDKREDGNFAKRKQPPKKMKK